MFYREAGQFKSTYLADSAIFPIRQDRLAIRLQFLDTTFAEVDRRDVGNVGRGPDGDDAGQGARLLHVDRHDAAMRVGRPDHAHVQLMRKRDVAREPAMSADQRSVFEPRDRAADPRGTVLAHASCVLQVPQAGASCGSAAGL